MIKPKKAAKPESRMQVARRDPGEAGAPGLFRHFDRRSKEPYIINGLPVFEKHALTKEDRKNGIIEPYKNRLRDGKPIPITKNRGYNVQSSFDSVTLLFEIAEGLEWLDLKVYKGLLAMAYLDGITVDSDAEEARHKEVHEGFGYEGAGKRISILAVGGYRDLARAIGYTGAIGGATVTNIKESINRLGRVRVKLTTRNEETSFNMISFSSLKAEKLTIGLNLRVVECLRNGNASGFTHIDLAELRQIDCAVTGLIHAKLEAFNSPGGTHAYSLLTLFEHVWAEKLDMTKSKHRMRLPVIRAAADKIGDLGWIVDQYRTDIWRFTRPKISKETEELNIAVVNPPLV